MPNTKRWWRDYKRDQRKKDNEIGIRYHSWEEYPGETYTEFKKLLTGKTL